MSVKFYSYIEKLLFDISALTAVGKARAASSGISKRFIYPIKEIIRVIIFSAINLLSIKKEGFIPLC